MGKPSIEPEKTPHVTGEGKISRKARKKRKAKEGRRGLASRADFL